MSKTRRRNSALELTTWKYTDPLYGDWYLPNIIHKLMQTTAMARLREISMGVMPYSLYDWVSLPSRFHHSMGVARLAMETFASNTGIHPHDQSVILAAALLHDAGSPAFSHTSEKFLQLITGKNGESFTPSMLEIFHSQNSNDRSVIHVLNNFNISVEEIMRFIMGKDELGKIIHGDMDLDNIDNICRFYCHAFLTKASPYHPIRMASAFKWLDNKWHREGSYINMIDVEGWETARYKVYDKIYSQAHMAVAAMIRRALYFAYLNEELDVSSFFSRNDSTGLEYLRHHCNEKTQEIANSLYYWQWMKLVADYKFEGSWPENLQKYSDDKLGDHKLADELAKILKISNSDIAVVMLKHNGIRPLNLSIINDTKIIGTKTLADSTKNNVYLLKVFVSDTRNKSKIHKHIESLIQ